MDSNVVKLESWRAEQRAEQLVSAERSAYNELRDAVQQISQRYEGGPTLWALALLTCQVLLHNRIPRLHWHLRWIVIRAMLRGRV